MLFSSSLSILINGSLAYLFYSFLNVSPLKKMQPYIEVHFENSRSIKKKIVKDLDIPEQLKTIGEREESSEVFFSKKTQRVTKQQRALILGPTQNVFSLKNKTKNLDLKSEAQLLKPSHLAENVYNGMSQIELLLPKDMDVGSFTVLNTDKLTYYSFFERVNNQIRFPWNNRIKESKSQIDKKEIQILARQVAVTHLVIVLSHSGVVQEIFLIKSSGIKQFDEAAALTFWEAKQFKNPPQGLREEDGNIYLRYQFSVVISNW